MAQRDKDATTTVDLERNEVALIIGEDDGQMSVRIASAAEVPEGGSAELAQAPEIVLALAMRLLRDPDFHDDMLDWYYEHQDDPEEDEEEE
jgi:hypothetical protein